MLLYPPSLPCIQYTVSHMLHRRMTRRFKHLPWDNMYTVTAPRRMSSCTSFLTTSDRRQAETIVATIVVPWTDSGPRQLTIDLSLRTRQWLWRPRCSAPFPWWGGVGMLVGCRIWLSS